MKTTILNLLELLKNLNPGNNEASQTYGGMRLIPIPVERNKNHQTH